MRLPSKWVVDVTFRYVATSFGDTGNLEEDKESLELFLTESSSCASNIVNDLARLDVKDSRCQCHNLREAFAVRPATDSDIEEFGDPNPGYVAGIAGWNRALHDEGIK